MASLAPTRQDSAIAIHQHVIAALAAALAAPLAPAALAQETRTYMPQGFEFNPTTPVLRYHFPRGKVRGTLFRGTWIAETVESLQPDDVIDSAEIRPGTEPRITFSLSRGREDWPPGQYRLEIRADGVLVHTEKFVVAGPVN